MPYLADTNILLRLPRPADPLYAVAQQALRTLQRTGERVYVTPQNFVEFWSVATRPESANGLGMTPAEAEAEVARLEPLFILAPDDPAIYDEWRRLVVSVGVSGAQVHDARLVAVMRVYGLTHVLTFNTADFTRYPDITVVRPQDIVNVP